MASSGRKLYYLLFLALVMSSETFGYAFILGSDFIYTVSCIGIDWISFVSETVAVCAIRD